MNKQNTCKCGNTHTILIKEIVIKPNAIDDISILIEKHNLPKDVMVVCDTNTYPIAGEKVINNLKLADFTVATSIHDAKKLHHPDEFAVGKVMFDMIEKPGMLIAIGSGTINDLCRFCAQRMGIPYMVVEGDDNIVNIF